MMLIALIATLLASRSIKLDKGPVPVEQAFELKRVMGEAAFTAEVDAVIGRLRHRAETIGHCASPAETAAAAQLELVRRTRDPQALARSRAAAEAALAQRRELRALYLGGAEAPAPYGLVSHMAARAKGEPNPRLAALYRRMAEDQFSRIDSLTLKPFFGPGVHTAWEKDVKGRPGRFGVIGDCTAPGVRTPAPLEDRRATDEWRAKAGMPPLAQYIATRSRGCAN
jgi:hypothetical protein